MSVTLLIKISIPPRISFMPSPGAGYCSLTVFISYRVLPHSLHPRHTDHNAMSTKCPYCSQHARSVCHSFFLESSSLRSLISSKFLLNSQPSLTTQRNCPLISVPHYSLSFPLTFLLLWILSTT